jgi:hypothetical protein
MWNKWVLSDKCPSEKKTFSLPVIAQDFAQSVFPRGGLAIPRIGVRLLFLTLSVLLGGCSDGLNGAKYASLPEGFAGCSIEFRPGHKAYLTMAGQTIAADYSVDGDRITLDTRGSAATVLTRTRDGTLTGGGFLCGTLRKTQ